MTCLGAAAHFSGSGRNGEGKTNQCSSGDVQRAH